MTSNNFVRFFGPAPLTTGMPANQCLLPTATQSLLSICRPTKFFVRTLTGAFNVAPFAGAGGLVPQYGSASQDSNDPHRCFSGTRTAVTFEGPFLRYTVDPQSMGAGPIKGTHNNTALVYFMDLVQDRLLYLPYPGALEIVGQYPGTWDLETFAIEADDRRGNPANQPTPLDSNCTLSLRLAATPGGPSQRQFKAVPPGCHSLTVNTSNMGAGGLFPTATLWQESAPTRGAFSGPTGDPLSTSVPLLAYGGVTSAFGNRLGQHNAWGASIDSGTSNADGMSQWHVAFT